MKIWPPTGLCSVIPGKEDEPAALLRCKATADIADDDAGVRLEQYFSNPSFGKSSDQEAVYKFPLIGDAAVYHFKSDYLSEKGEVLKTLIGKAKEKQQAREEYEEAKANGKTAQLLEMDYENSPDLFTMSLGNIPVECKTVHVEIAFHCPLQTEEKGVVKRFTLPSVLTGRYGKFNPGAFTAANVSSGSALLDFEANICLGNSIASLESPTHKIASKLMVDGSSSKATVTFAQDKEPLQEDLVLKMSAGAAPKSSLLVQSPESMLLNEDFAKDFPDTTLAKLTFNCNVEPDEDAEVKKNFVFVVDRSGSMSGASIRECKKALLLCLTSLPEDCCFDICSFGDRFDFLFGGKSQDYSAETLEKARAHVESMTANYGGTEILRPLQEIVKAITDIPTVVFLLTDGQVYNTAEIVKLIKKEHEKSGTTLFSCGIGSGVDRNLVDGLAKAGGGTATYIAYGEKMNAKLAAQMEQAIEPPCVNLKVDLGALRLSSSKLSWNPVTLLPAFAYSGQRIDCYLALDSNSVLELRKIIAGDEVVNLTLTGKMNVDGKEQTVVAAQVDLKSDFLATNSNLVVPAFRQQIKVIEEQIMAKKSEKKRAIQFAVAANIVTKYTSLVAVEVGNEKVTKESKVKKAKPKALPVPALAQYSGRFMNRSMAVNSSFAPPPPPAAMPMPTSAAFGMPALPKKVKAKKMSRSLLLGNVKLLKSAAREETKKERAEDALLQTLGEAMSMKRAAMSASVDEDEEDEEWSINSDARDQIMDRKRDAAPPPAPVKPSAPVVVEKKQKPAPSVATDDDKLTALVSLQQMNGSFEISDLLKQVVGKTDFGEDEKLPGFATALIIKFLEIKLAGLGAEWKLMRKKAMKWLKKNTADHAAVLEAAAKHI